VAARRIVGGGDCILGCVDRSTGKTRKAAPHSKTGICATCLHNLSVKRAMSAPKLAIALSIANVTITRIEEAKQYPKGYARLGGRPIDKHK
jgi:hypothetical protein